MILDILLLLFWITFFVSALAISLFVTIVSAGLLKLVVTFIMAQIFFEDAVTGPEPVQRQHKSLSSSQHQHQHQHQAQYWSRPHPAQMPVQSQSQHQSQYWSRPHPAQMPVQSQSQHQSQSQSQAQHRTRPQPAQKPVYYRPAAPVVSLSYRVAAAVYFQRMAAVVSDLSVKDMYREHFETDDEHFEIVNSHRRELQQQQVPRYDDDVQQQQQVPEYDDFVQPQEQTPRVSPFQLFWESAQRHQEGSKGFQKFFEAAQAYQQQQQQQEQYGTPAPRYEPAGYEPAGYEPAGYEPAGYEPAGYEAADHQPAAYQTTTPQWTPPPAYHSGVGALARNTEEGSIRPLLLGPGPSTPSPPTGGRRLLPLSLLVPPRLACALPVAFPDRLVLTTVHQRASWRHRVERSQRGDRRERKVRAVFMGPLLRRKWLDARG